MKGGGGGGELANFHYTTQNLSSARMYTYITTYYCTYTGVLRIKYSIWLGIK